MSFKRPSGTRDSLTHTTSSFPRMPKWMADIGVGTPSENRTSNSECSVRPRSRATGSSSRLS